jgi:hypothetical protein
VSDLPSNLNDDPTRVERDRGIPRKDGDRIFVGAWSRGTIRRAAAEPFGVADQGAM